MSAQYLTTKIVAAKLQPPSNPYSGMTRAGYTKRSGAPSGYMIRLDGETRWRRVMVWQFSNAGTCFVRVKGQPLIVNDLEIQMLASKKETANV
jgi:hypothetical protein